VLYFLLKEKAIVTKGLLLKNKRTKPQEGGNPNPGLKSLRSNPPAREIKEKGTK